MEVSFAFAKKMNKPGKNQPGITLRSVNGSCDCCTMVIMAASYGDVREQVQNYRLLTARDIKAAARGKSLEIKAVTAPEEDTDAISLIFDFARGIKFNSDDALDAVSFMGGLRDGENMPVLKPLTIALQDGSMELDVVAEAPDDREADTMYGAYEKLCEAYGVGMIKKRPE